jgi:phage virion morphogenesis protein
MIGITIKVDDRISPVLAAAMRQMSEPDQVLDDIGNYLLKITRDRFNTQTAPDGTPWAPRAESTLERYRRERGTFSPRILHFEGVLSKFPAYEKGLDYVAITPNPKYAAMMQFGGTKAQFPHLWGDIPARPYIGFNDENIVDITHIIEEWLARVFE